MEIRRAKLREWLNLEDIRERILITASRDNIATDIYLYLSIAFNIDTSVFETLPWYETIDYLFQAFQVNTPQKQFPILSKRTEKQIEEPWDYEGRTWYLWANIFAQNYGWTLEYIAELDIDDAIGLMEEIVVNEQMRREWEWALTEIAYPYNEVTKRSEFHPLPRPEWMKPPIKLPQAVKLPEEMLPVGVILRANSETFKLT